tara:strand:+ start:2460 stop:2855 length:396 start_codon:yes stop_codon:yes gene_type:complete
MLQRLVLLHLLRSPPQQSLLRGAKELIRLKPLKLASPRKHPAEAESGQLPIEHKVLRSSQEGAPRGHALNGFSVISTVIRAAVYGPCMSEVPGDTGTEIGRITMLKTCTTAIPKRAAAKRLNAVREPIEPL